VYYPYWGDAVGIGTTAYFSAGPYGDNVEIDEVSWQPVDVEGRGEVDTRRIASVFRATFAVSGLTSGVVELSITSPEGARQLSFGVASVEYSRIYLPQSAPWDSEIAIFVDSTSVYIEQNHYSRAVDSSFSFSERGEAYLMGVSPFSIDRGETDADLDDWAGTPNITVFEAHRLSGRAVVTTEVGGELQIDLVDEGAIKGLTLVDDADNAVESSLMLKTGERAELFVRPSDEFGRTIFGNGRALTAGVSGTAADLSSEFSIASQSHVLIIDAVEPGDSILSASLGSQQVLLSITVE
jgi:hypothetical protein